MESGAELGIFFVRREACERREEISGQRHPKQALRQLHQADRISKGGDDVIRKPETETLADQNVDLKSGHAEDPRQHLSAHKAHRLLAPGGNPAEAKPLTSQQRQLISRLGRSSQYHAQGNAEHLPLQRPPHHRSQPKHRPDHHDVQHYGPKGRHEEMSPGVEHAHKERGHADE